LYGRSSRSTIAAVHFVYIVRCADGTLYTGYARDPNARIKAHNSGRGARYTSGRRPVRLVYSESFESIGDALRRERALKQRSRAQKEELIGRRVSPRRGRRSGSN
jgi:putative endonuclease